MQATCLVAILICFLLSFIDDAAYEETINNFFNEKD